jgi:hypothetical protein
VCVCVLAVQNSELRTVNSEHQPLQLCVTVHRAYLHDQQTSTVKYLPSTRVPSTAVPCLAYLLYHSLFGVRCSLFAVPNSARTHARVESAPRRWARSPESLFTVRCSLFTVRNTERTHTLGEGRRQLACGARVRCSEFAVRSSLFRTLSARTHSPRAAGGGRRRARLLRLYAPRTRA